MAYKSDVDFCESNMVAEECGHRAKIITFSDLGCIRGDSIATHWSCVDESGDLLISKKYRNHSNVYIPAPWYNSVSPWDVNTTNGFVSATS